jgi:hypothetical protein
MVSPRFAIEFEMWFCQQYFAKEKLQLALDVSREGLATLAVIRQIAKWKSRVVDQAVAAPFHRQLQG